MELNLHLTVAWYLHFMKIQPKHFQLCFKREKFARKANGNKRREKKKKKNLRATTSYRLWFLHCSVSGTTIEWNASSVQFTIYIKWKSCHPFVLVKLFVEFDNNHTCRNKNIVLTKLTWTSHSIFYDYFLLVL